METYGLEKLGILNPTEVHRNLSPALLVEAALRKGRGRIELQGRPYGNDRKIYGTFAQGQIHCRHSPAFMTISPGAA